MKSRLEELLKIGQERRWADWVMEWKKLAREVQEDIITEIPIEELYSVFLHLNQNSPTELRELLQVLPPEVSSKLNKEKQKYLNAAQRTGTVSAPVQRGAHRPNAWQGPQNRLCTKSMGSLKRILRARKICPTLSVQNWTAFRLRIARYHQSFSRFS